MNYFKKILKFAIPYKRFGFLSIICNIFYALFSTLSFLALIPVIEILFDKTQRVTELPVWNGWLDIQNYATSYFYYNVSERVAKDEIEALIYICIMVVILFFLGSYTFG